MADLEQVLEQVLEQLAHNVEHINLEQNRLRRRWLMYIATTTLLILSLSFGTALALAFTFAWSSLTLDMIITGAVTLVTCAIVLLVAKYTPTDYTRRPPKDLVDLYVLRLTCLCYAIITCYVAAFKHSWYIILLIAVFHWLIGLFLSVLAAIIQELIGDRFNATPIANNHLRVAIGISAIIATIYLSILFIVSCIR